MLASKIRYITWVHLWGTNGAGAAENHHLCALSSKNFGLIDKVNCPEPSRSREPARRYIISCACLTEAFSGATRGGVAGSELGRFYKVTGKFSGDAVSVTLEGTGCPPRHGTAARQAA